MAESIIKIENLSKQYRLGTVGTKTLQGDIKRWWAKINGKEDPFSKIGESNSFHKLSNSEYLWALRDINLEIKQGEVLGIIGKNGAGKSTLLKIISRITTPTTGSVTINGRIASLLEVGTGFHPELTGRENVFLNGSILGMTKAEIKGKFDEIVDFSGVERYIDTPVKRYSSGMYVRLAFAVAAHLEPEILVVDEVLAVGDAEFQKKAIGKMNDISKGEGRTVLFVSHNMAAVKSLCNKAIVLEYGQIVQIGNVDKIVNYYLSGESNILNYNSKNWIIAGLNIKNVGIKAQNKDYYEPIVRDDALEFAINYELNSDEDLSISFRFKSQEGTCFLVTTSATANIKVIDRKKGKAVMTIPGNFFNEGVFFIDLLIVKNRKYLLQSLNDILCFNVNPSKIYLGEWMGKSAGFIKTDFIWE